MSMKQLTRLFLGYFLSLLLHTYVRIVLPQMHTYVHFQNVHVRLTYPGSYEYFMYIDYINISHRSFAIFLPQRPRDRPCIGHHRRHDNQQSSSHSPHQQASRNNRCTETGSTEGPAPHQHQDTCVTVVIKNHHNWNLPVLLIVLLSSSLLHTVVYTLLSSHHDGSPAIARLSSLRV